jgi:hypothetical protein
MHCSTRAAGNSSRRLTPGFFGSNSGQGSARLARTALIDQQQVTVVQHRAPWFQVIFRVADRGFARTAHQRHERIVLRASHFGRDHRDGDRQLAARGLVPVLRHFDAAALCGPRYARQFAG